jgi:hypothetical protein
VYTSVRRTPLAHARRLQRLLRFASLIVPILIFTACEGRNRIPANERDILRHADRIELLSLEPRISLNALNGGFHGYLVLGTTVIEDADTRKRLISAFEKGVAENQGNVAACFDPRHGIRASSGGHTVEFVICFTCAQVEPYTDGVYRKGFWISGSPLPLFNQVLRDAKVPLPTD